MTVSEKKKKTHTHTFTHTFIFMMYQVNVIEGRYKIQEYKSEGDKEGPSTPRGT